MNKDVILGIVRHILTTVGGVLAARGYIDNGMVEGAVGAILTLVGVGLSVTSKKKAE
jgi:hypothetical protein